MSPQATLKGTSGIGRHGTNQGQTSADLWGHMWNVGDNTGTNETKKADFLKSTLL